MTTKADKIVAIVVPVLDALGLKLWGIEYIGQGRHTLLRVYIDKDSGINVDDCAEASRQISSIMDVEDPIQSEYTLEVSSPGIERLLFTLEQYRMYVGTEIKVRLQQNFAGRRNFSGILAGVQDEEIEVVAGEDSYKFPFEIIDRASLVYKEV